MRFWMISAPIACRAGAAGWPWRRDLKLRMYMASAEPQSIRPASTHHSSEGDSCMPQVWLKSSKVSWRGALAVVLYMDVDVCAGFWGMANEITCT